MSGHLPEHLRHWPGLFEWRDGRIADAPEEDVAVAKRYPDYPDKGPVIEGVRLTIMSGRSAYRSGDAVRVIHVVEMPEAGQQLAVAGPKPVYGEYVDGRLATPPPAYPGLVPPLYNGEMLASPAVDYNYEITSYRLEPGDHEIQWRLDPYESNRLSIRILSPETPGDEPSGTTR